MPDFIISSLLKYKKQLIDIKVEFHKEHDHATTFPITIPN